ncbi:MAG TPA: hypothetical protein PL051_03335 [Candidatus Saccharibacteria bacterium]|nr:hypothetical protein [Candidatus Saccharibacteria bacterium]
MTELLSFEKQDTPLLLPIADLESWREMLIGVQIETLWWDPEDETALPDPGAELIRRVTEVHSVIPAPEVRGQVYKLAWEIGTYSDDDEKPEITRQLTIDSIGGTDE